MAGAPRIAAGARDGPGQSVETKEGVVLEGAHQKMRDDDAPGTLTHGSAL
jgi:hypothetical protein